MREVYFSRSRVGGGGVTVGGGGFMERRCCGPRLPLCGLPPFPTPVIKRAGAARPPVEHVWAALAAQRAAMHALASSWQGFVRTGCA